jgi:sporulation protein YlmC with PRC-barrel domain
MTKLFAAALVTTALATGAITTGAIAQSAKETRAEATTAASHRAGDWRGSKLSGVNVYNDQNEKIGDISDVIVDRSGKITNVVIGVGGFLGMGEHYVAVAFDKLKWSDQPVRSASRDEAKPATNVDSNARTAADGTRTTGAATTTTTNSTDKNWYPDHAVYNATKDQLKAMPEFKY